MIYSTDKFSTARGAIVEKRHGSGPREYGQASIRCDLNKWSVYSTKKSAH